MLAGSAAFVVAGVVGAVSSRAVRVSVSVLVC